MKKRETYFSEVRKHSKLLYRLLIFGIGIQLLLTAINLQVTPFYVWSMYAAPEPEHADYDVYVLRYNGMAYNYPVWKDHKKGVVNYTLPRYEQYMLAGGLDPFETKSKARLSSLRLPDTFYHKLYNTPEEVGAFPLWLKKYVAVNEKVAIDSLIVEKYRVRYLDNGRLAVDSFKTLIRLR